MAAVAHDRFHRSLAAGEAAFVEGEVGDCAYVIDSGSIEICKGVGAERKWIATLGRGEIFGEMALLDHRRRAASAVALEPTTLTVVTREYLNDRLEKSDPLLRHLVQVLSQRLRANLLPAESGAQRRTASVIPAAAEDERNRLLAMNRLQLVQAIQEGLERGEFQLFLQPIVRLADSMPAGFEGLIRWNRPGHGYVSPAQFIPVAEQSEQIVTIGHWAIATACAQLAQIDRSGAAAGSPVFIGVNLSARQFADDELYSEIAGALAQHKVPAARLKLEITESLLIENFDAAAAMLRRCKELGLTLALDDFGAGYSSLAYLSRLPVDMLKLDRSLIADITTSDPVQKIVRAVALLGKSLGMAVLAEGVENEAGAGALHALGIEYAQGWAFAKAMPLAEAINYLRQSSTAGDFK